MNTAVADSRTAAEYRAAVAKAVVFPSNAGRLCLTGGDARDLLNRLSTNLIDPAGLPGEVAVTVLTSDRGRIVDLVYVIHRDDHQLMLTSPGQQQTVIDFLDKYTIMEDLEVEDITGATALLTLTGPAAADILNRAQSLDALPLVLPANPDDAERPPTFQLLLADHDGATQVTAALESAGAVSVSPATAETLRIARRQPAHGFEMSDTYNPLEAGLIGAIDFHKGCYIGQEVIARLDTYQKVQKYLVALRFDADPSDTATLPGARLVNGAGAAMGLVTSVAVVPEADGPGVIGLGYVRTAAVRVGNFLKADAGAGEVTAQITAQPLLFGGEKPGPAQPPSKKA